MRRSMLWNIFRIDSPFSFYPQIINHAEPWLPFHGFDTRISGISTVMYMYLKEPLRYRSPFDINAIPHYPLSTRSQCFPSKKIFPIRYRYTSITILFSPLDFLRLTYPPIDFPVEIIISTFLFTYFNSPNFEICHLKIDVVWWNNGDVTQNLLRIIGKYRFLSYDFILMMWNSNKNLLESSSSIFLKKKKRRKTSKFRKKAFFTTPKGSDSLLIPYRYTLLKIFQAYRLSVKRRWNKKWKKGDERGCINERREEEVWPLKAGQERFRRNFSRPGSSFQGLGP